jgi:hypothetical protein
MPTLLQSNSGYAQQNSARVGAKGVPSSAHVSLRSSLGGQGLDPRGGPENFQKERKKKDTANHQAPIAAGVASPANDASITSIPSDSCSKGAISLLQEFVQCSKQHKQVGPQNRPILQWDFDTRMADFAALQFRATVAFLLDGVPHHAVGEWHLSKKHAQRDAAERALGFYVGRWGQHIFTNSVTTDITESADAKHDLMMSLPNQTVLSEEATVMRKLYHFCQDCPVLSSGPQWSVRWDGGMCQAFLEVPLLGVPHKLGGCFCDSEKTACADAARRVLWYLQCPGFDDSFELDPNARAATARDIPGPPEQWVPATIGECQDGSENDADVHAQHLAERKTALMRVQNRLQQAFARQLRPGQSVWEWSFETDSSGTVWPPLCRATATVPAAGKHFVGEWARGQRDAQLNVCMIVGDFLDAKGGSPKPKSP